jgi:steroid delta-isomerase-like uncharacterized protein
VPAAECQDVLPPEGVLVELEANKAVVREFAEAINARDWKRLDKTVAPDFVRHSSAAPAVRSREELKRYVQSEFEIFPDGEESIEDMVAEGDKVAVRHSFRGTQLGSMGPYPPSGKRMVADYLAIYRLAEGVIVEAWAEWDNLSGLQQLGHVPAAEPGAAPDRGGM